MSPRGAPISAQGDEPASEPDAVLDACGLTCGQLEPLLAERMRSLAPGAVLEIRSNEAAAADGIASWSWLSGNAVVAVARDTPPFARYYVKKGPAEGNA